MVSVLGGIPGVAIIALLLSAIRHSYAVEARSDPEKASRSFGYTNLVAVALNAGVARDAETQALRAKVLMRLAVIGALFAALALLAFGLAADRMD